MYNKLFDFGVNFCKLQELRSSFGLFYNFSNIDWTLTSKLTRRHRKSYYRRVVRWSHKLMLGSFFKLTLRLLQNNYVHTTWFNKNQLLYSYHNNVTVSWASFDTSIEEHVELTRVHFTTASVNLYKFKVHRKVNTKQQKYTNNAANTTILFKHILPLNSINKVTKLWYTYLTPQRCKRKHYSSFALDFYRLDSILPNIGAEQYMYQIIYDLVNLNNFCKKDYIEMDTINISSSTDDLQFAALDGTEFGTMVYTTWDIPQIKFNPGLLVFLRKLRYDYAGINNVNIITQRRLTRYLHKFKRINNTSLIALKLLNLDRLLVKLHICVTQAQACNFINCGFVYINGIRVYTTQFQLQVGDYVQIRCSYIMYNYIFQNNIQRNVMLATFVERNNVIFNDNTLNLLQDDELLYHVFKRHFKRSRMLKLYNVIFDIPGYVELDFITLSFIIVHFMTSMDDYDYISIRQAAVTYHKMLNWKYIT